MGIFRKLFGSDSAPTPSRVQSAANPDWLAGIPTQDDLRSAYNASLAIAEHALAPHMTEIRTIVTDVRDRFFPNAIVPNTESLSVSAYYAATGIDDSNTTVIKVMPNLERASDPTSATGWRLTPVIQISLERDSVSIPPNDFSIDRLQRELRAMLVARQRR